MNSAFVNDGASFRTFLEVFLSFLSSLEANSAKELYVESMAACKGSQIQSVIETSSYIYIYIYSKYTKDSKDSKYFILLAGFNSFAKSDSPVACSAQER